jgi:Tfp pilus assembly protein PilX
MRSMIRRLRDDDTGSALITALLATVIMLGLGLALLSTVDIQASQSSTERTRDRGFNLAESVLNSEAFVLGRNWPGSSTVTTQCGASGMGFMDTLGSTTTPTDTRVSMLRSNLNGSYTDSAYSGAGWQVNVCDDSAGSNVWSNAVLSNLSYDSNNNKKLWVIAKATVGGKTRTVAGVVSVRTNAALNSKYGLAAGSLDDDLGTTVSGLGNVLGGQGGVVGALTTLLGISPVVAPDPTLTATTPPSSGVIGVRCGLLDLQATPPASTCLTGTIGALGTLPVINSIVTGGKIEQFPTTTAASALAISQLRKQAVDAGTYTKTSAGSASTAIGTGAAPACTITGTPTKDKVVFIEQVGTGDQYCTINVSSGVQYKALVIGSGRVILRGSGSITAAPVFTGPNANVPQVNTFSGVVYALNLQRLTTAEGGLGLGDATSPGREVIRIDNGAHVKGSVNADGKSAKVGIYPPFTFSASALVDSLIPCEVPALNICLLRNTLKALDPATELVTSLLNAVGLGSIVNGVLSQLSPQNASYGSPITSDVTAINALTVTGASGVVPSSFRELTAN